MKKQKGAGVVRIASYYVYLLSGILFFGIPNSGKETFSALVMYLLGTFAAYLAANICVEMSCGREHMPLFLKGVFQVAGLFIFCALFGIYSMEFAGFITSISEAYGGARFSHFFILATLLLALYMGKRREASFCRLCVLFLPLAVLPYVITWFVFLGYSAHIPDLLPDFSLKLCPDFFASGFCNAAGIFVLERVLKNNREYAEEKRETAIAFILFAITCVLETAKSILWFGASGLLHILRPDMIMLASVPFMNVQELFLLSYYFAFVSRACIFCTCARHFAESIPARRFSPWIYYSACACILYVFHTTFVKYSCPVAEWQLVAIFFAGIILYYLPQKIKKTHKSSRNA